MAPEATLNGLNMLEDQSLSSRLHQYTDGADVVNQSWGRSSQQPFGHSPLDSFSVDAIETRLENIKRVLLRHLVTTIRRSPMLTLMREPLTRESLLSELSTVVV